MRFMYGKSQTIKVKGKWSMKESENPPSFKPRVGLLLGGALTPARRESALKGEKPRIDVMEMECEFGGQLFDYVWLEKKAEGEFLARILVAIASRVGHWSEFLVLRAVWEVRKLDAVYATGEDVGVLIAILLRLFNIKRPRLVMRTEQPVYGSTPFRRLISKTLLRLAVPRIETILCRTEAHRSFFLNEIKLDPQNVLFQYETTDAVFFNPRNVHTGFSWLDSIRRPYILSAGLEMRDYETLIDAVKGLPLTAIIAAGSPWAKVRYDAAGGSLPDNVVLRSFSPLEMRELYRSAALVVLPIKPTQRACGMNVILEAWSMGQAVIASRTEGLTSYIEDRTTGYFVSPGDIEALREAILHLLGDKAEAEALGARGQAKVRSELHVEKYIAAVRQTLTRAVGEPV
jgi:glycosyltransferase involved in cell wall biosynthesis